MRALRTSETLDDELGDTPDAMHDAAPDDMHDAMHARTQVHSAGTTPRMVLAAQNAVSSSALPAMRLPRLSLKEAQALSVISRRAVDCYIVAEAHDVDVKDVDANSVDAHDVDAHAVDANAPRTLDADVRTQGGSAWRLSMTAGRSEPVAKACDIVVHLNWSGARMRLMLPARAVTVWMASRLRMDIDEGIHDGLVGDEPGFTGMAGIAREAALEAMLGEALDRLGLSGLGKPELIGIEPVTEAVTATPGEMASETARATPSGRRGAMHAWLSHPLPHHFVVTLQADVAPIEQRSAMPNAYPNAYPNATPDAQLSAHREAQRGARFDPSAARLPTFMACLETDGFGVMLIASLVQHLPEMPAPLHHDALRQQLRLIVGGASSTLAALQDLRAGDIVRCDWCSLTPRGPKWLAATASTGQRWRLQMDPDTPGRLIFLEQSDTGNMIDNDAVFDDDHNGQAHPQLGEESIQALEALPVKVSFDLGSVTVALSTLRRWQPGEAIELTAPVTERQVVNIRANGMLIGQGELVDIDGHLGVIVSTLSEAADHE